MYNLQLFTICYTCVCNIQQLKTLYKQPNEFEVIYMQHKIKINGEINKGKKKKNMNIEAEHVYFYWSL